MQLRIISGLYGGRKILSPKTSTTHPMGDRVRSAMFNSVGEEVVESKVLDAFAGSGAVGLEAISRGAKQVTFIEKNPEARRTLTQNISLLGVERNSDVVYTTVDKWIDLHQTDTFDLIFADPPYDDMQFSTILRLQGLLKPKGLMVLSHAGIGEVPTKFGIVVVDNRSYGNANLAYFRRDAI